jgi:hypothetical protein
MGVLTLTSALLLALAPAPLTPDASSSLFALNAPESMDVIFQTQASMRPGRWKYIYIHHSRTASGNALTLSDPNSGLGDHFVVCNGNGAIDGELQVGQRWTQQLAPVAPPGASFTDSNCISICVVGDFDRSMPTPTQIRRLTQLVNSLQGRLDIPAGQVLIMNQPVSSAGLGKYFPATAFRQQLLP